MSQPWQLKDPSAFFLANQSRLRDNEALGPVLDLACGQGRHALAAAKLGLQTIAIDRDAELLEFLAEQGRDLPLLTLQADLETEAGIPVQDEKFGAILVFCFLYRPLAPAIIEALAPGGLLLYQTFTEGQLALDYGPSNPEFLLRENELLELFAPLEILEYWEGLDESRSRPKHLAQLAARKPAGR